MEWEGRLKRPADNGTLLNDDFACLAKYNFLTGISLDGPAEVHNEYRIHADKSGTRCCLRVLTV